MSYITFLKGHLCIINYTVDIILDKHPCWGFAFYKSCAIWSDVYSASKEQFKKQGFFLKNKTNLFLGDA